MVFTTRSPPCFSSLYDRRSISSLAAYSSSSEANVENRSLISEGLPLEKLSISRFKGLGEMSEKQLAEAAFHPDTRRLLPVTLGGIEKAQTDAVMGLLMGKGEATGRRSWMEMHGDDVEVDV